MLNNTETTDQAGETLRLLNGENLETTVATVSTQTTAEIMTPLRELKDIFGDRRPYVESTPFSWNQTPIRKIASMANLTVTVNEPNEDNRAPPPRFNIFDDSGTY